MWVSVQKKKVYMWAQVSLSTRSRKPVRLPGSNITASDRVV